MHRRGAAAGEQEAAEAEERALVPPPAAAVPAPGRSDQGTVLGILMQVFVLSGILSSRFRAAALQNNASPVAAPRRPTRRREPFLHAFGRDGLESLGNGLGGGVRDGLHGLGGGVRDGLESLGTGMGGGVRDGLNSLGTGLGGGVRDGLDLLGSKLVCACAVYSLAFLLSALFMATHWGVAARWARARAVVRERVLTAQLRCIIYFVCLRREATRSRTTVHARAARERTPGGLDCCVPAAGWRNKMLCAEASLGRLTRVQLGGADVPTAGEWVQRGSSLRWRLRQDPHPLSRFAACHPSPVHPSAAMAAALASLLPSLLKRRREHSAGEEEGGAPLRHAVLGAPHSVNADKCVELRAAWRSWSALAVAGGAATAAAQDATAMRMAAVKCDDADADEDADDEEEDADDDDDDDACARRCRR